MNQKEIILCAAVKLDDTIICGYRHGDCYKTIKGLLKSVTNIPDRENQGFLTSKNRYVNRKEAWKIAEANNQIQFGYAASNCGEDSELISENLY